MTIQEAYEQEITTLGRTTWGRAAWLELRVVRGLLSMTAVTHSPYQASRETPLHQLPHDGWERWTHHTAPDLADPPQDDKPSQPLPGSALAMLTHRAGPCRPETAVRRAYERCSDVLARHHGSDPYHDCAGCPRVQRAWEASLERVRQTERPQ